MLNLALAMLPKPSSEPEEGLLGKFARWGRQQIRYRLALNELRGLDDRDLDDIAVAREDFHDLAWRHSVGLPPLSRPQR